jgi:hypothetical protein
MSSKNTAFYRDNKAITFDFSGEEVSSDAGLLLLYKLARKHKLIKSFSRLIPDPRNQLLITYKQEDLLLSRVLLLACGYEDANDYTYLGQDPILDKLFKHGICSQPTITRLENRVNLFTLYRLGLWWIDRYVESLPADKHYVVIDVDCTDDPTHGNQQGSLFHGYYWQYMLNELFYLDGESGQVILPVLRPGNVHSNKWNERFLRIIVEKLRARFPDLEIVIRADSGFSGPAFYELMEEFDLGFCVGITTNNRLKELTKSSYDKVKQEYADQEKAHQLFVGPFDYQADSWEHSQQVYSKIESTGKGMNRRFFVANFPSEDAEQIYWDFYVQRGETAENRIKEIKNMCFSDRLSCHAFTANYLRLMLSCLAYELLRMIRQKIAKYTKNEKICRWSMNSIRLYLLKVAAKVKIKVRSIHLALSRAFPHQQLFTDLVMRC